MSFDRILILEDNQIDFLELDRCFQKSDAGFKYVHALSISEMKSILQADNHFDLLLLDYNVNDGTAFDIMDLYPDFPVIVMTSHGSEAIAVDAMKRGAIDYIVKDKAQVYLDLLPIIIQRAITEIDNIKQVAIIQTERNLASIVQFSARTGHVIYCNDTFAETLKFMATDVVKNITWYDFVETNFDEIVELLRVNSILTGQELLFRCLDGKRIFGIGNLALIESSVSGEQHIYVTFIDITAQKEAEFALRESEERYRFISESLSDSAFIHKVREDGTTIRDWSIGDHIDETLGYPKNKLYEGNFIASLIHPDDYDEFVETLQSTYQGKANQAKYRIRKSNGDYIWLLVKRHPIWNEEQERVTEYVMTASDITTEKEAELALRASETRYRAIIEQQTDAVCRYDSDLRLNYVNNAYIQYFGGEALELVGTHIGDLVVKEDIEKVLTHFNSLTPDNPIAVTEHRSKISDGSIKWFQWVDHVILDNRQEIIEYQSVGRDITERKLAELALQESETRLAEAQSIAHIGNWEMDCLTGELQFSDETFRILGMHPREPLSSRRILGLVHPDDRDNVQNAIANALETGYYALDNRLFLRSGTVKYVNTQAHVRFDEDQKPLRLVGTVQDITDRKRIEQALNDLNDHLEQRVADRTHTIKRQASAMDATVEGMAVLEGETYIYVNSSFAHMFGYEPEELIGKSWRSMYLYQNQLDGLTRQNLEIHRVWTGEILDVLRRDGSKISIEMSVTMGPTNELICTCRDITERKQQEKDLERTNTLLQKVLDTIPIGVYWKDQSLTYVNCNRQYAITHGQDIPEKLAGKNDSELGFNSHYISDKEAHEWVVINKQAARHEYFQQRILPDGSSAWFQSTLVPLINSENQVTDVLGVEVDITGLKKAQEELTQALAKERELNELKSRFVSITSHEFRTPLASISATSETLRDFYDRMTDNDRAKRFNRIMSQVRHMTSMLDDVLLVGQIEEGKLKPNWEQFDLSKFFQEIVDEFKVMHDTHIISCICHAHDIIITADKKLIRHICTNLVSNAIKYSAEGSTVYLSLSVEMDQAYFSVRDEGMGIPEADRKNIFEAFHRAENARTIKGTGLGLSIAKRAVAMHSGTITFETTENVGTTFSVKLPLNAPRARKV